MCSMQSAVRRGNEERGGTTLVGAGQLRWISRDTECAQCRKGPPIEQKDDANPLLCRDEHDSLKACAQMRVARNWVRMKV